MFRLPHLFVAALLVLTSLPAAFADAAPALGKEAPSPGTIVAGLMPAEVEEAAGCSLKPALGPDVFEEEPDDEYLACPMTAWGYPARLVAQLRRDALVAVRIRFLREGPGWTGSRFTEPYRVATELLSGTYGAPHKSRVRGARSLRFADGAAEVRFLPSGSFSTLDLFLRPGPERLPLPGAEQRADVLAEIAIAAAGAGPQDDDASEDEFAELHLQLTDRHLTAATRHRKLATGGQVTTFVLLGAATYVGVSFALMGPAFDDWMFDHGGFYRGATGLLVGFVVAGATAAAAGGQAARDGLRLVGGRSARPFARVGGLAALGACLTLGVVSLFVADHSMALSQALYLTTMGAGLASLALLFGDVALHRSRLERHTRLSEVDARRGRPPGVRLAAAPFVAPRQDGAAAGMVLTGRW